MLCKSTDEHSHEDHETDKKALLRQLQKTVKQFLKFYITFSTNNDQTTHYDSSSAVAKDLLFELNNCLEYGATETTKEEGDTRLPFIWGILQDAQTEKEIGPGLNDVISQVVSSKNVQFESATKKWHACTAALFNRGVLLSALTVNALPTCSVHQIHDNGIGVLEHEPS